ncbi:MAG TPA: ATP-binding protein [Verrucomicrobiae bacterium]|nr:ATP-binding protein [Verrucomicrobiae bacterium]
MSDNTELYLLKDAEAKYRGMFENAVEGIYQSTPDGHFLAVNTALARMYGYERPEELLSQVSDIQSQIYADPTFRERFKQQIDRDGFVHNLEYQVRQRNGRVIWISESARAVRDENGEVRFYEGFIDNITARKDAESERARLEKQMLQAQKMDAVGTLAGGMAHDFNNILCAILGYTELALFDAKVEGRTRENLQSVFKSAQRAQDLIKRILTFSRPRETERRPLKFSSVIQEAVKLLNATLPSSIEISVSLKTDDDIVVADATEMHQVIMNLGTNAGHAMKVQGGKLEYILENIRLDAAQATPLSLRAGTYVQLTARDNGCGMSREILDKIFEPFFTTKAPGRGTGLGLTLVQKIVARSEGQIFVESEPGKGTAFHIYLPHSEAPLPNDESEHKVLPGQNERILVIDDEIPVLSMMQQRLRLMGYRVVTRADSLEALQTFRAEPSTFDLVITDHTMPSMLGAELAERVGELRPDLPVVLMTGLNQPPNLSGSPYAAKRAVFQKPIDFVELSQRMRKFLDRPSDTTIVRRRAAALRQRIPYLS